MLMPVLMCLRVGVAVMVMKVLMLVCMLVCMFVWQSVCVIVSVRIHLLQCSREHRGVCQVGVVVAVVGFVYMRRQAGLSVRLCVLILVVKVSVWVIRLPALAHELHEPAPEERRADGDHHQPGGDAQPGVQLLGQDEARGEQGQ